MSKKKSSKKVDKINIKEEKSKINFIKNNLDNKVVHNIMLASFVVIFFCLFYFLTVYITNKNTDTDKSKDNTDTNETISYTDIIVGESFSMDGEYLVFYYDKSDEDINSQCSEIINSYSGDLTIYNVDMSSGFNKKYSKDESNINPSNASEIAINGPTLMKVSDKKVSDYIQGIDEITNYLQ